MKRFLPLLCILTFGCASQTASQKADDAAALQSALVAGIDYAGGQDPAAALNALSAASYLLRSLQSTPQAASAPAVTAAVQSAGVSNPTTANIIASAVAALVSNGHTPSDANEEVASALDSAVAQSTPK